MDPVVNLVVMRGYYATYLILVGLCAGYEILGGVFDILANIWILVALW
jgi:hypothetical protein